MRAARGGWSVTRRATRMEKARGATRRQKAYAALLARAAEARAGIPPEVVQRAMRKSTYGATRRYNSA